MPRSRSDLCLTLAVVAAGVGGCADAEPRTVVRRLDLDLHPLAAPEPPPDGGRALPSCAGPHLLFLNFDGAMLHGSPFCSNAADNCSFIIQNPGTVNYRPFAGAPLARQQVLALVTQYFAPFNVQIVTTRPTGMAYEMCMVGGRPEDIGLPGSAAGAGPLDCGNDRPSDVSFAFSDAMNNDPHQVAVTIAQESAHAMGLGHVADPTDIMYPSVSGQESAFHDRVMRIDDAGGTSSDCTGSGMQNDVQLLTRNVGTTCTDTSSGDHTPPRVAITQPRDGERVAAAFSVAIDASDDSGTVTAVGLFIDDAEVAAAATAPFRFDLPAGSVLPGPRRLVARGRDAAGNLTASAPVSIVVNGPPPPQPDGGVGQPSPPGPGSSRSGDKYRGGCQAAGQVAPGATAVALLMAVSLIAFGARPLSRRRPQRPGRGRAARASLRRRRANAAGACRADGGAL
jgi:hypothetical protein